MMQARMRTRWREPQTSESLEGRTQALASELDLHPLAARLLVLRGMTDATQARAFLKPSLTHLADPLEIPGIDRAARRIVQAVRDHQPIVIYGDYDVDGVTASAILWHMLTIMNADVSVYVPHRIDEGYGLNEDAIRCIADGGWRMADGGDQSAIRHPKSPIPLIVSVDCGITAVEPARVARELGVDLIITDHHTFDADNLPDAHTLVHPRLNEAPRFVASSNVPGPANPPSTIHHPPSPLCGAGMAFKLGWQIAKTYCGIETCKSESKSQIAEVADDEGQPQRLPAAYRDLLVDLLSLAALGTIADVVPLVGENRVLTVFGLGRIKRTRFLGLNALIDASKLRDETIGAYHVGFVLGPRLNACGRMGHAARAVQLLTRADESQARETAAFLTKENDRRRSIQRAIFEEARDMACEAGYDGDDCRAIVLGKEGWHPGVIGIVASRMVETFARPVVLLNFDNGTAHGSARSVDGVSIHAAFCACASHLTQFGGHDMAAGLTLATDAVDAFRDALVEHINAALAAEDLARVVEVEDQVRLEACSLDLFDQLLTLAPFGRGNTSPRLMVRGATVAQPPRRVGAEGRHLSLMLRQGPCVMKAIAFGMGELAQDYPAGTSADVVFEPKVSTWRGLTRPELHIKDIRLALGRRTIE